MIGSISKPPAVDSSSSPYEEFMNNDVWSSSGTAISAGCNSNHSITLSEVAKRKIIDDMKIVAKASVDITEMDEFIKENGDKFKNHTKEALAKNFVEMIMQKAVFTQQKIAGPIPTTRIRSKVVIMSEDELLKLIDNVINYSHIV
jgi:hypothetical protein